ncbi:MAG: flagellar biosynthesis protein FlhB [Candidatus Desulfatibia sp.]|uniref:flagellar biosynthesis protein FlhB n=1 Tax=Candidatus Desulfatibia sp. TaxID=3101189 RepID=UPI002F335640
MAEESNEEKTEEPTPRKRQELREKGEVAKSRELPSVAVLLASLMALTFFGSFMYSQIQLVMQGTLSLPMLNDLNVSDFIIFAHKMTIRFILAISPLMAAVFITAILSNIIQVGFILSSESITPKLSKLDPIKGFTKLFSKQSLMELGKNFLKLAIIGAISYYTIKAEMKNVPMLGELGVKAIWVYILTVFLKIFLRCTLAMVFVVVIDYAFQRWEFENKIKMGKQEIKDEHKKTEGDPLIKSRIKSIQMEMARKRMMQDVPEADVVITNPVRLAVAVKYDSSDMGAPKVLAKGAGEVAKKIIDLATEHDIPILEKKELAQSLYKLVEIGQEVPAVLYQAVAEVLAYIYKLKGKLGL